MRAILTIIVLTIFYNCSINAQCDGDGEHLVFTSQAEIDSFPPCEGWIYLYGVRIIGPDITNLNGLSGITGISGTLTILNTSLKDLSGLENLKSIGGFSEPVYGNWHAVNGLQIVSNDSLENISHLSNLEEVAGSISVIDNKNLTSLEGLNSLSQCRGMQIKSNESLLDFGNMANLSSLGSFNTSNGSNTSFVDNSSFIVSSNNQLKEIDLPNLTHMSGGISISLCGQLERINIPQLNWIGTIEESQHFNSFPSIYEYESLGLFFNYELDSINFGQFQINGQNQKIRLTGSNLGLMDFSHITSSIDIEISHNHNLDDLKLNNTNSIKIDDNSNLQHFVVEEIHESVSITNNPYLSTCSNTGICNRVINGDTENVEIDSNALGCNSLEEVINGCVGNLPNLKVSVFFDKNLDGIKQSNETILTTNAISIEPSGSIIYTINNSPNLFYLDYGTYEVNFNESKYPDWELTTPNQIIVELLDTIPKTVEFGMSPTVINTKNELFITSSQSRCNEFSTMTSIVQNSGTSFTSGTLWIEKNPNISDTDFIDIPDTTTNTQYGWYFDSLPPLNTLKKEIRFQIPGPDDFTIGDDLIFNGLVEYQNDQGAFTSQTTKNVTVLCAYDPNDKLVEPVYPDNYALIGENLIYTVRFQNTGNAEAYDVTIEDQLDPQLDWNTFRLITSSHTEVLSTTMNEDGLVTFSFKNIFLPDSTSNFEASQGFVMYSIQALEGIDEESIVINTASIIFDSNPPIITNTTENILVSSFDADQDGSLIWDDCNDFDDTVSPEFDEIPYNGIDDDCDDTTLDDDLDQDGFNLANDCDDSDPNISGLVGELELCDGMDNNCNGEIDEGFSLSTFYVDHDGDGFGDPNSTVQLCGLFEGYSENSDDCDDTNPDIYPGAIETCDDIDNNCDGEIDEGFTFYEDADNDGYGNPNISIVACSQPNGYVQNSDDCDDTNPDVYPQLFIYEIPYNGLDDDCNPNTPDDDLDQDGFNLSDDCDDHDPNKFPGNTEVCDSKDNDCNDLIDEDLPIFTYYLDNDNDGYGLVDIFFETCQDTLISGFAQNSDDCDDSNPNINPEATEIVNNGIDEDCDGMDEVSSTNELDKYKPQIFPNPVKDILNIKADPSLTGNAQLIDCNGRIVITKALYPTTQFDMDQLAVGIYILRIESDLGVWVEKVVKQN